MLTEYFDSYAAAHEPYKGGAWCYEDGLIYRGLELLHKATGEARWFDHLHRLITPQLLSGPKLLGYDETEYNIDNILSGRALLYLYDLTGEDRYLKTADLLVGQLSTHPRTNSGVYWHKKRYPWQIWLDGLYMGPPFQIAYGMETGRDELVADALVQVSTALDLTYVPETRLYAHAYDEARAQPWAQKGTGHTRAHWARALGWLAMGLVDIADLVGPERFRPLAPKATALFDQILRHRQPDGLWLQVIDQPTLEGNWPESSASAMFSYALLKAKRLQLVSSDVDPVFDDVVKKTLQSKPSGGWEMTGICHVAGLGMYEGRFRDGTAQYYISERQVSDDTKGVGPLMMAYAIHRTHAAKGKRVVALT